jgi:hypothetical protein
MKLYPLEPSSKLAAKISGVSKRIKMDVFVKGLNTADSHSLVVIGNGTPDDIAFSIVAFHLNGDKIAGIVKPKTERRYSFINMIPLYLSGKIRNILILMDQEDDPLTAIYERIKKDLERLATGEIELTKEETTERVRVYKGSYGSKEFELILVINGLDEIGVGKHSIEDHLLKAAGEVSIEVGDFGNAKDAWRALSNDQQLSIYKVLKDHRKLLESVFPQQVFGCQYIE